MGQFFSRLFSRLKNALLFRIYELQNVRRLERITRQVDRRADPRPDVRPVAFFNASTRLISTSLNAGFSMLTAWGLRLAGVPVVHFVCRSGMTRCVLGTNPDDYSADPPCQSCIAQSKRLYNLGNVRWFRFQERPHLENAMKTLTLPQLTSFVWNGIPLGEITTPSLRWILRRHTLKDDRETRLLLRQFILSAYHVGKEFELFLDLVDPSAVVVFNGTMYPEQMARRVARQRGLPVISHEVSFQPLAGYFTRRQATAYHIDIPEDFQMSPEQDAALDAYLEQRFKGQFTMAGITFWPEMRGLDQDLLDKIESHQQVVPVFTNVIFDTSQPHANVVFEHMFAWLDLVLEIIQAHPQTLFVIRAHPDELRPGTRKQARESVHDWVKRNKVDELPNVVFIESQDYVSSYELIHRSKFVMVYNSSIALETTLLGKPVLCGGKSRFTAYDTVFFPQSAESYRQQAGEFLAAETIEVPPHFKHNARRFLYFQNWRTPIPFDDFLQPHSLRGFVRFKKFPVDRLLPENFPSLNIIQEGIMEGEEFLMPDPFEDAQSALSPDPDGPNDA